MHPRPALTEVAAAKALLRRRLAARRTRHAVLANRIVRPLVWIDLAREGWGRLPPGVRLAVPAVLGLAAAALQSRLGSRRGLRRWWPLVEMGLGWWLRRPGWRDGPPGRAASPAP